jgi:hypothetical protein
MPTPAISQSCLAHAQGGWSIIGLMDFGLSFDSSLSFEEMLERLNAIGPWTWTERDSAWFGNIAKARAGSLMLDLVESGPNQVPGGSVDAGNGQGFSISVRWRDGTTAEERAAIEEKLRRDVLPHLGAVDVRPTDPID